MDEIITQLLNNGDDADFLMSCISSSDVIRWMNSNDFETAGFVHLLLEGKICGGVNCIGISRDAAFSFNVQYWRRCLKEDVEPCYMGWRLSRFEAANEVFDFFVENVNLATKEAVAEQNSMIEMLLELTKNDEAIASCWQVTIADRLPRVRRGHSALKKILRRFSI